MADDVTSLKHPVNLYYVIATKRAIIRENKPRIGTVPNQADNRWGRHWERDNTPWIWILLRNAVIWIPGPDVTCDINTNGAPPIGTSNLPSSDDSRHMERSGSSIRDISLEKWRWPATFRQISAISIAFHIQLYFNIAAELENTQTSRLPAVCRRQGDLFARGALVG